MKIRKFNEATELKPSDKVVRVTFSVTLDIPLDDIKETDYYNSYHDEKIR